MFVIHAILLAFLITLTTGVYAGRLIIKSQPEQAEIFILNGDSRPVLIGKTPFETYVDEIIKSYVKSSSFIIELRKDGHEVYRVLLARTANVDLTLSANLELSKNVSNIKEHDLLMNELFDVQKLIRARNFNDAINKLGDLEKKNPGLSIIPELRATALYLNKNVEGALSYYRKAFSINPDNADAYRMKVYLEKKLGVDSEMK
jgi:tetratricopeptide (TPR) repeat protein